MIVSQYLILASEFVQHITVIVLVGFVVTECVACYAHSKRLRAGLFDVNEETLFRKRKQEYIRLLFAVLAAALWLIIEFFVNLENLWYHALFHIPAVAAILIILWPLSREGVALNKRLFGVLLIAAIAHMSLDAFSLFGHHLQGDAIIRAVLKTMQALALYFFVLTYTIISNDDKKT